MKKFIVIDCEGDGLLDEITKLHVLAWTEDGKTFNATADYDEMRELISDPNNYLVCHYVVGFDAPAFKKILGVHVPHTRLVDTLALSWYLHHKRSVHGLESYGVDYGVPKPVVTDWSEQPYEVYENRCIEDVKINWKLWKQLEGKLKRLYGEDYMTIVHYLNFKMDCAREQEQVGWRLDVDKATKHRDALLAAQDPKVAELQLVMPQRRLTKTVNKPKVMEKKDGSVSSHGAKWYLRLENEGLPKDHPGPIEVFDKFETANPNSTDQVKEWLYSFGWKPSTFKFSKNTKGEEKQIPQVRKNGELCSSVKALIKDHPEVEILDGLTVIQHRLGFFNALLDSEKDGYVKATIAGFTNTLRFKHSKPLANIPGVDTPWGNEIRECLIVPDDHVLCGSDMCSLEATTKAHYMYEYDPEYALEIVKPEFDEHLDLAKQAGEITQEDIELYLAGDKPEVKAIRSLYKPANYSAIYGIGAAKLGKDTGLGTKKAQALLDVYWERNAAIKKVAANLKVRNIDGEMWLFNPVSKFYYSLRYDKDRFSTLNQGTGVYCFDNWVYYVRNKGWKLCGQFHDEIALPVSQEVEGQAERHLTEAIAKVNDKIQLNVKLDVDIQFGKAYNEVH